MSLDELRERLKEIPQADERRLQELKTELLGRKAGALTEILKTLPSMAPEERKEIVELLEFGENTAAGRMNTEFLAVNVGGKLSLSRRETGDHNTWGFAASGAAVGALTSSRDGRASDDQQSAHVIVDLARSWVEAGR